MNTRTSVEMDSARCTTIEETFLRSSDSHDPYVIEAIDATLDHGDFNVSSTSSMSDDNESIYYSSPQGPVFVIFTDYLTGLVNGAIVKFYGFPKYARTRDNIITAPEYILLEIIEGLERTFKSLVSLPCLLKSSGIMQAMEDVPI